MATEMALFNPKKRKSTRTRKRTPSRKTTTRRRSYRRNPSLRGMTGRAMDTAKRAAIGAGGALAVDFALTQFSLPGQMQTGWGRVLARGLIGVGLGAVVSNVLKMKTLGNSLADGAVTVAMYSGGKEAFGEQLGLGYYQDESEASLLGYYNPAQTFNFSPAAESNIFDITNGQGMGYYEDFNDMP